MNKNDCHEIGSWCKLCGGRSKACLTHDEYFACEECGERALIDKADVKKRSEMIFKKVFGAKPEKPENN